MTKMEALPHRRLNVHGSLFSWQHKKIMCTTELFQYNSLLEALYLFVYIERMALPVQYLPICIHFDIYHQHHAV